jgi:hypothetical protein
LKMDGERSSRLREYGHGRSRVVRNECECALLGSRASHHRRSKMGAWCPTCLGFRRGFFAYIGVAEPKESWPRDMRRIKCSNEPRRSRGSSPFTRSNTSAVTNGDDTRDDTCDDIAGRRSKRMPVERHADIADHNRPAHNSLSCTRHNMRARNRHSSRNRGRRRRRLRSARRSPLLR